MTTHSVELAVAGWDTYANGDRVAFFDTLGRGVQRGDRLRIHTRDAGKRMQTLQFDVTHVDQVLTRVPIGNSAYEAQAFTGDILHLRPLSSETPTTWETTQ